ncbi:MAG: Eco57I restriction-modification methylase domain-containing protein, partial [Moraxellaceae bacterium]|nr:Eco57I restriction-modification methylase domain-containing protein [Moraxellaceae bacterium]
ADYNGKKRAFSTFRRYSYFIDNNQTNRTFKERFGGSEKFDCLDDILTAFSVEPLNKEFYNAIQKHFDKLKDSDHNNEFSVRLIGRLLFCWFLKKRQSDNHQPLIPDNLLSEKSVSNHYYHNIIEPLFFDTLNTPIADRQNNKLPNHATIPYLNGGLFEKQTDDNTSVSDEWFTAFFDTLEQYNFTVDENSSTDTEVGIDPEMLGTIFENLLAEQDPDTGKSVRKSSGSFYTPRVIVDYMVEQSLTAYLQQQTEIDENRIASLFTDKEVIISDDKNIKLKYNQIKFDSKEQEQLLNALFSLKTLDPACGSGAFPVGVMQKMLGILRHLDDDGKWWRDKHKKHIKGESQEAKNLRLRLDQADADYVHKLGIISRCLYGVDIQPIASEIAKLRCFLSLIIDEKIDDNLDNRGILPLPNLEFKFVTANTLLDLPKAGQDRNKILNPKWLENLSEYRRSYLQSYGKNKSTIKNKFNKLQEKIQQFVPDNDLMTQADDLDNNMFYQLAHWQPFNSSAVSPWFDQKLMFGVDEFNMVIGNPPYVQLQKIQDKQAKEQYKKAGFVTHKSTGDLYGLFYERGVNLLKDNGFLCYITSNKWMRAGYGDVLRGFFARYNPIKLLDFAGFKVFESATVDTNILLLGKSENQENTQALHFKDDYQKGDDLTKYVDNNAITNRFTDSDTWAILSPIEQSIKAKIERIGTPLKDWDINIYRGVLTGYNEAFIITGEQKDELIRQDPKSAEIIKPILRGKDIKKYAYDFADLWLIATFPAKNYNIDDFPAIKRYLQSFGKKLKQTGETYLDENGEKQKSRKKTSNKWFETQDQIAYFEEFEKEKIVWNRIASEKNFGFIDGGIYIQDSMHFFTSKDLKYICCMLNAKLYRFLLNLIIGNAAGGNAGNADNVTNLPLIQGTQNLITIAEQIIEQKANNQDTTALEKQVDNLVYELYELTDEEIAFIESKVK